MWRVTFLAVVTALAAAAPLLADDPAHKLQNKKEASEDVRNHADWLLLVNTDAILGNKGIKNDSPAWVAARDEVTKRVARDGKLHALHVRFYFADRSVDSSAAVVSELRAHIKKLLANVDVYVVCVDSHTRNDSKTWAQFLQDMTR